MTEILCEHGIRSQKWERTVFVWDGGTCKGVQQLHTCRVCGFLTVTTKRYAADFMKLEPADA